MRLFLDTNILVELIENRSSADYVYEIMILKMPINIKLPQLAMLTFC